jgi:hypothetical protein
MILKALSIATGRRPPTPLDRSVEELQEQQNGQHRGDDRPHQTAWTRARSPLSAKKSM